MHTKNGFASLYVNFYSSSWPPNPLIFTSLNKKKKRNAMPTPDPHSFSCSYYTKTNYVISYNNTENQATHHIQLYTHVHTIQLFYLLSSKASSKEISSTWILNCADLLLITNRREKTEKQFKSSVTNWLLYFLIHFSVQIFGIHLLLIG